MTEAATTTDRTWQQTIADEIEETEEAGDTFTHIVVWHPQNGEPAQLMGRADNEEEATTIAGTLAERLDGEIRVATIDDVLFEAATPTADNVEIEEQRRNEETTEPERELEQPDAVPPAPAEDAPDETPPAAPDTDGKKLFDDSDYEREDLAIAKVDGESIDRIAVKFSGSVMLDRSEPADVALFNRIRLGKDITIMVEARGNHTGASGATNKDGDLDVVVGEKALKVHTVYVPAGKLDSEAA